MKIIISNEKVKTNLFKPFTENYDYVFVSIDENDFLENNGVKLTEKNIQKLLNSINYSWDGEIYWFKKEDKTNILEILNKWFNDEENHTEIGDNAISNCFLIKNTPNGLCLIDTQFDLSSNVTSFLKELEKKLPGIEYKYYGDSHLIENIHIGRGAINNEFEMLNFFYKEEIIDESFFINGISAISEDPEEEYFNLLPKDKEIVITGKLSYPREEILSMLNDVGYKTAPKVTSNTWLWLGKKVGANKIEQAKIHGVKLNTIEEVIEMAYQQYLSNKKVHKKNIKP